MRTSIREALVTLRTDNPLLRPDLGTLRRIAALAAVLRSHHAFIAAGDDDADNRAAAAADLSDGWR